MHMVHVYHAAVRPEREKLSGRDMIIIIIIKPWIKAMQLSHVKIKANRRKE